MSSVQPTTIMSPNNLTFPSFPKHPIELRLIIWKLAANEPLIIDMLKVDTETYDDPYYKLPLIGTPYVFGGPLKNMKVWEAPRVHGILHTNREARSEALKYLTLSLETEISNPIYLNFSFDIFSIDTYRVWERVVGNAGYILHANKKIGPNGLRGDIKRATSIYHNGQNFMVNENLRGSTRVLRRYHWAEIWELENLKSLFWTKIKRSDDLDHEGNDKDLGCWMDWGLEEDDSRESERFFQKKRIREILSLLRPDKEKQLERAWGEHMEGKEGIVRVQWSSKRFI